MKLGGLVVAGGLAAAVFIASQWAAGAALGQGPDMLDLDLASRLSADYGVDVDTIRFAPLKPEIIEAVEDDNRALATPSAQPADAPQGADEPPTPIPTRVPGQATPAPNPTATPTLAGSPTHPASVTPSATSTPRPVNAIPGGPTVVATSPTRAVASPTLTPTRKPQPSPTPTRTPTPSPTLTPTSGRTATPVPTRVPTSTSTPNPAPTVGATVPVLTATPSPTATATPKATATPTLIAATATPTAIPTPTALIPAQALKLINCSSEENEKSGGSQAPAVIVFVNEASATRQVFWLNGGGERVYYGTLGPSSVLYVATHPGNAWLVADGAAQCIGIFKTVAGSAAAYVP